MTDRCIQGCVWRTLHLLTMFILNDLIITCMKASLVKKTSENVTYVSCVRATVQTDSQPCLHVECL